MKNICVFAGASSGNNKNYNKIAIKLGAIIAQNNLNLIYGGGKIGMMGEVASSCLMNGGHVVGIIPKIFINYKFEVAHESLSELIITENMHERKKLMYDRSDCFCVLPGGLGTLDELMEVLTWTQIGILSKNVYIINVDNYWNPLITLINNIVKNNFMDKNNLNNFKLINSEIELKNIFKKNNETTNLA